MSESKIYFRNLDAIRFIAAMMVLLGHAFQPSYRFLPISGSFFERLLNTISSGETGVSIFFVLSGFLITYLLVSEYEIFNRISLKQFYIRRVLRIWPLYYFVVFFSFMIYPVLKSMIGMNNPLGSDVIYHLFFLSNFDVINIEHHCYGSEAMSQNITWSVSVEEQFYLFWPLIFVLLPRKSWRYAIVAVIAGSLFFRMANTNDGTVLYFHTLSVLVDLGIGGLMALLIKTNHRIRSFFEQTKAPIHFAFFSIAFILVCWNDSFFSFHYGNAISRLVIAISFALIIASQAMTKNSGSMNLQRLTFASRWGKYTYGIYLLHPIALTLVTVFFRLVHFKGNDFLSLFSIGIFSLLFTLLLSRLSYRYFESHFLKMKDRFTTLNTRV